MLKIALTFSWLAAVAYNGGFNPGLLLLALGGLLAALIAMPTSTNTGEAPVWAFSGFDLITALLFVVCLASYFFSILPGVSLDPALSVAALAMTYWVTRYLLSRGVYWHALQLPLWIAAAVVVSIALPEFLIVGSRPFVTFGDANALAAFFNALFFPTYFAALADWRAGKPLVNQRLRMMGLLALLMAIAATTSLSGQLCFAGGLALSTILVGVRQRKAWLGLLIVAGLFLPAYFFTNHYSEGREAASRLTSLEEQQSFTERIDMAHSTLNMYADGPWYGSGIGTYKTLYPSYRRTTERSTSGDLAHNDYLQFLAEGGPVLMLCLMALTAMTARRLWQLWRRTLAASGADREAKIAAGYGIAVLCLLVHATMNFILYVLPLSMVIGFYLARQEHELAARRSPSIESALNSPLVKTLIGFFALFLVLTLGPRSVFAAITGGGCQTRACETLRNGGSQMPTLANMLAATQPTWLWSRDYIVQRLVRQADETTDPAAKLALQGAAVEELSAIISDAPAVHFPYTRLADLLELSPTLSVRVSASLPALPSSLHRMALDRRPFDQTVRLKLAAALEKEGHLREAFDLVNTDGMRWWKTALVPDTERVAMLRYMIPRAVGFGLCEDALGMAGSLGIFVPDSALAKAASQIATSSGAVKGCGLGEPLPAE